MSLAADYISKQSDAFIDLARWMWENPETAFKEVKTAQQTAIALEKLGFEVETGAYGLPTCVVGRWGSGHPVIGFLGELDALPGMSQKLQTTKEPVIEGAPGQACGHNLLNVSHLAAAAGAKAEMEAKGLQGTIVFYGCPAEEQVTGKAFMARGGAFRDLDTAYAWHGSKYNEVSIGSYVGVNSAIFHFKGRTAHAGGDPQNGRSALDAAELMNVGANYLREHVTSDVRIHYCYKEAGTAPNIVPDRASVWYYVRAMTRDAVEDTYKRLIKVARGAAMMTETELEIEYLGGCYNTMPNEVLSKQVCALMEQIGAPVWTKEELELAETLNKTSPLYEEQMAKGLFDAGPLHSTLNGLVKVESFGSTDVGDVEYIVPCTMVNTATYNVAASGHSWQLTVCAGTSIGFKGMLFGAQIMAAAAIELIERPDLLEAAKAEFAEKMKGRSYICPIPDDLPTPQPDGTSK